MPATLPAPVAIFWQLLSPFISFFLVSFSIVRCLQRFSSPAGHFDCLIKLAPRRQLKNCDLLPLETNFLHANDIIRYIYMLFSLLLSFSGILRCPCIVVIATPLSKLCDGFTKRRSPPRWVNSDEGRKRRTSSRLGRLGCGSQLNAN